MIDNIKNNKKIKVGMLISTYFPIWGGAQKQLYQLGKYLLEENVELFILTRLMPESTRHDRIGGINIYRMFVTNRNRLLDSLLYISFSLFWLFKNRPMFNILHCYQIYSPTSIGVLAKKLLGNVKVLVKVTASNEYGETEEIKKLPFTNFRIKLLKNVDKFLVVNRQIEKELNTLGIPSSHIEYIPNGVEIPVNSSFQSQVKSKFRHLLGLNFEKIAIFTGRLSEEKCLDTLLQAWSQVCRLHPKAQLLILGEGAKERNVEEKIIQMRSQLKLHNNVQLLGKVDNVTDFLLASDIFVLPSVSEGLSNSLLEAMAAGLGVIAGDNDGNRHVIINGENGILVKPKNIKELYLAILTLIENEDYNKQLGRKGRETVKHNFSLRNTAQKHINLYHRALMQK